MRYVRSSGSPNFLVGIFLLVLLSVFAGPNLAPRLASAIIPGFDEGVPCQWLRVSSDRARHQSLIGRAAENPIVLAVRATPITRDPAGILAVTISVTNRSLGTVPFVFDPTQVTVGDNGTTGLGVIFTPANSLTAGFRQGDPASFPEPSIRLLAPRQTCVVRLEFPNGNVLIDPAISTGAAQVRAFYRANTTGQVAQSPGIVATPIYYDQGLWTGYVESLPVSIPAGQ